MAVDARGFQLVPDAGQAIAQGVQTGTNFNNAVFQSKERANQEQLKALLGQGDIEGARQVNPQATQEFEQNRNILAKQKFDAASTEDKQDLANHVTRVATLKTMAPAQRVQFMQQEIAQGKAAGRNMAESENVLETLTSGTPEQIENTINGGIELGQITGTLKGGVVNGQSTKKSFQPVTLVNAAGDKMLVSPTTDNRTGQATLEKFQIPEGFEISTETPEEKRAANILAEGAKEGVKVTSKGKAARQQETIQQGRDSASGFANVTRAIELIDGIKTGGIDKLQLTAKRLFGIESADEAELSNRMGKAVLSQLRQTFGAAFTAQEGKQLTDIEANFGKSTEGNRRLLKQVEQLILNKANRAIKAAVDSGDLRTAADIQDSLDFRFTDGDDLSAEEQAELEEREAQAAAQ